MTTMAADATSTERILPGTDEFASLLASIAAGAKDRDLNDENPFEQINALRRARFGALRLPPELGGPGFTVRQTFSAVIDMAHADPIVAHILRAHFWFVEERLRTADDPISRPWLKKIAEGKIFGNAFSEKGTHAAGSTAFFKTRLLPAGAGGYRLNGEKYYSTGTLFSDYLLVSATTDHDSLAVVVIPADREGVRLIDDWDGFGQRRTGTGTTTFTNVVVSPDELLADSPNSADPVPTVQWASLQLYIDAVVAGILAAVVDDGIALLRSRDRSFSHAPTERPSDDPLLQRVVGDLASTAYVARAAVLDAADAIAAANASMRNGVPDAKLAAEAQMKAAQAKVHIDGVAPAAATKLLELGGASAASRKRNLDRHWRNIRTITLHSPASYKARAIGQNLLHSTPLPTNGYF